MGKKVRLPLIILISLVVLLAAAFFILRGTDIAVLNPQGEIAQKQLNLIIFTSALSLLIVIPVFAMTFYIVWKYRVRADGTHHHKKAAYHPEWDHNRTAEVIWWLIPLLLIGVLAVITWKSSHELDPYKPIISDKKPLNVQVIALEWKWLFIYPDYNIATVNYMRIPEKTPINMEITADAPMNSLWIPKLGGQVYAMAGMQTKLHLIADKTGDFPGSSANISGEGFAGMKFMAEARSQQDFDDWVASMKSNPKQLNRHSYDQLAKPSKYNTTDEYVLAERTLYDRVIMKYMMPGGEHH